MVGRAGGKELPDIKADALENIDLTKDPISEILTDASGDPTKLAGARSRLLAARKTRALVERDPSQAKPLIAAARRLIFAKGTDSHDYKFSSAVLEDYYSVAAKLRPAYLATSMFNLKGREDRDNGLIRRARAALGKA